MHMLRTAIAHDGPVALRYPRGAAVGVPLPERAGGDPDRHRRDARRGRARGAGRLWDRRADRARRGRGAARARDRADGLRRALREASRPRAAALPGGEPRAARDASRRTCSPAASARPCSSTCPTPARWPAGPAVIRFGLPDRYVTHGKPALLHEEVGLTPERVAERVLGALDRSDVAAAPSRMQRALYGVMAAVLCIAAAVAIVVVLSEESGTPHQRSSTRPWHCSRSASPRPAGSRSVT